MRRFALVALVFLAVAVTAGFGGSASTPTTGGCRIHTRGNYPRPLDAALPDGSFVVGSEYGKGKAEIVHLQRVLADCQIAATFGAVIHNHAAIALITATSDGRILLGAETGHAALVGRLLVGGGMDRSFGSNGWTRLVPPRSRCGGRLDYAVSSIDIGPTGTIVVGWSGEFFHCELGFVSELTQDGSPIQTFGRHGSAFGPGGFNTRVYANADGSIYALGEVSPPFPCAGFPYVARMLSDGSLDPGFDKSAERTINRITGSGRAFRPFWPTVVPDGAGGFTLVGGLDAGCPQRDINPAVTARVGPSGHMVGTPAHFRVPGYSFDAPTAIRLPSGRIVAAGEQYAGYDRLKTVLVQVLGPDGSRDSGVGAHGLLRFAIPRDVNTNYADVDFLSGAGGSAWLVTDLPHEIDLTALPVP